MKNDINNLSVFLDKIKKGRLCAGLVIGFSDSSVSELAGDAGYDFTWIDMEHAPLTIDAVKGHVMAVRGTSCAPFVRVPWNEQGVIKPLLDLAPAGVIIPMVNDAASAAEAVAACRYPPAGIRGCGIRRGNRYGAQPLDEYLRDSAANPLVIVQIEHINALGELDRILKTPGINSICVGPTDLSGSMGKLGRANDPEVLGAIDEICRKTREAGLMLGTADSDLDAWSKRGVDWMAITSDSGSIFSKAVEIMRRVEDVRAISGNTRS